MPTFPNGNSSMSRQMFLLACLLVLTAITAGFAEIKQVPNEVEESIKDLHDKYGIECMPGKDGNLHRADILGEEVSDVRGAVNRISELKTLHWVYISNTRIDG